MNDTAKLHFIEWQKPEQGFTLVSWRSREGILFVREPNGDPKVLRLDLPAFHQHVEQEASLSKERGQPRLAWPDAVPVTIAEVRLMPPPCRGNLSEAELLRQKALGGAGASPHNSQTRNWELARLRYDAEVLVPTPADKDEFDKSLERFLADRQKEYDERKLELATLKALVDRRQGIFGHARYYSDINSWPESSREWRLQQERLSLELDFPQGCLQWTVVEAHHRPSIRNPILRARWFQTFGLTPEDMRAQRRRFLDTLPPIEPRTDFLARWVPGLDFLERALGYPICYRPLNDLEESFEAFGDATWEHLTCCAQVRFLVTFEDQTHIWFSECLRRAPQNQGEREEFLQDSRDATTGEISISTALIEPTAKLKTVVEELNTGAENLTKAGQQARADVEAGASTLAARTEDLAETLGKVPEVFADPLVAAAKNASIKRGVPEEFAWWVFQERHFGKFPTGGGAFKRCGLGPKRQADGLAFSRATVYRWLAIIREELDKRNLTQKRSPGRSSVKARGYDVAQAKDAGPLPGGEAEPPEAFVQWVEHQDAAGAKPTKEDVLAYVRAHAASVGLTSYNDDELGAIADRWLKAAIKTLNKAPNAELEPDEDSDR